MQKTIAKLTLLQHGLMREAQALDEMNLDSKKSKKTDNLEDQMEEDGKESDKEDDTINRIGKLIYHSKT